MIWDLSSVSLFSFSVGTLSVDLLMDSVSSSDSSLSSFHFLSDYSSSEEFQDSSSEGACSVSDSTSSDDDYFLCFDF